MEKSRRNERKAHAWQLWCGAIYFLVAGNVLAQPAPTIAPLPTVTGALAGTIGGEFKVSATGSATYTVPLAAPPGTNGMAPQLSLVYDSSSGTGLLGPGWTLSGLSVVSRCPATFAQDGFIDGVNFNSNDRFCLDGQRLIAVSGAYGADSTQYRTLSESYAKIVSHGQSGVGPASFTVHLKNGLKYEYGHTLDARLQAQGEASILGWKLNRVTDRNGNSMRITYEIDLANGENVPSRIDYTVNESAGLAAYNSVQFEYETVPLAITKYLGGAAFSTTKHLKTIKMYTGQTNAWEYRLWYLEPEPVAREVRLASIVECGANGECLPPTNLFWTPLDSGQPTFNSFSSITNLAVAGPNVAPPTGDWNGDGKTDFAQITGNIIYPYVATASGFSAIGTISHQMINNSALNSYPVIAGDWDGDGLTDLARVIVDGGGTYFYRSNGSAFTQFTFIPDFNPNRGYGDINANPFFTGDWNGDGRTDIGRVGVAGVRFYVSNGTSFSFLYELPDFSPAQGYAGHYSWPFVTGDWNGDGLTDIARTTDAGMRFYVSTGTQYVLFANIADFGRNQGYSNTGIYPIVTGDWNGDGLTDIARVTSQNLRFYESRGNGTFIGPRTIADFSPAHGFENSDRYPLFTGDWNGDGNMDFARVALTGIRYFTQKGGAFTLLGTLNAISPEHGYWTASERPLLVGDWNGDGFTDIGRISTANLNSYTLRPSKTNLINNIIDGNGKRVQITFKRLAGSTVYTKGSGSVYPRIDLTGPFAVVSETATTDGIGGFAWMFYHYKGLRAELNGLGISGFEQIEARDFNTGLSTTTKYRQDFPYTGQIKEQFVSNSSGTVLSSEQDTWAVRNLSGGNYFPHITRTISTNYELDGSFVSSVTKDYTYDDYGNPSRVAASHSDNATEITDHLYANDESSWFIGQLLQSRVTKTSSDGVAAPVTRLSSFTYFPTSGMLQSETLEPDSPALSLVKTYQHDSLGNTRSVTISGAGIESRTELTEYNDRGQWPIQITNSLGQVETRDYDARHGQVTRKTEANSLTTQWNYDAFGRLTHEYRPDGTMKRLLYLAAQAGAPENAVYFIREDGSGQPPVITYYDLLNREIQKVHKGFDGRTILIDQVYDERGRLSHVSDPYFEGAVPQWTVTDRDLLGRIKRVIAPGNRQTESVYNGLTATVTNPLGQRRTQTTDAQGRALQVRDHDDNLLSYNYDGYGNPVRIIDSAGNTTTIEYDVRGQKIRLLDPDTRSSTFTYDALGQLLTQTNASGQTTRFTYDKLGRVTQKQTPEGVSRWFYDGSPSATGKVVRIDGLNGYRQSFVYDSFARVATTSETISNAQYTLKYGYDQYGRLARVTYPSGFAVKHAYNLFGYLSEVQRASDGFVYWQADNRNAQGQLERQTLGNGLITMRTFSPTTGLPQNIVTSGVQSLAYQFDNLGNVLRREDQLAGTREDFQYDNLNRLTRAEVLGRQAIEMTYNAIGNITYRSDVGTYTYGQSGAGPHAVTSIAGLRPNTYTYDLNGNRRTSVGGSTSYDSAGKPISIIQGTEEMQFTLDPSGNRIEERTYSRGVVTARKTYVDPYYERVESGKTIQERHYIRGGDGVIAIYTTTRNRISATLERYAFTSSALRDDERLALLESKETLNAESKASLREEVIQRDELSGIVSSKTRYLHGDHLGSIQTITDESGRVIEVLSFDSWGQRRNANTWAPATAPIRATIDRGFTGHEHLDSVGLIHMNGRVYDPVIGRFISPDPFVQSPSNLQSLNRYTYANNNPLSFTDPSGFFLSGLFRFLGKLLRTAVPMILSYVAFNFAGTWVNAALSASTTFAGMNAAVVSGISGAAGGFAASLTSSILRGGNLGADLLAGLRLAPINFLRGFSAHSLGDAFGTKELKDFFGSYSGDAKAIAHGVASGALSELSGGKFSQGFSAAFSGSGATNPFEAAVLGGTASALSGGKFQNGALQGAFVYLYNEAKHEGGGPLKITIYGSYRQSSEPTNTLTPFARGVADGLGDVGSFVWGQVGNLGALVTAHAPQILKFSNQLSEAADFLEKKHLGALAFPVHGIAFFVKVEYYVARPPQNSDEFKGMLKDLGKDGWDLYKASRS